MKKKLTVGILAHVDAGKTTLSEALLFCSAALYRGSAANYFSISLLKVLTYRGKKVIIKVD